MPHFPEKMERYQGRHSDGSVQGRSMIVQETRGRWCHKRPPRSGQKHHLPLGATGRLMGTLSSDAALTSLRRSRVRRRAFRALARLGRGYPAELARESGLALRQVRLAIRGAPPDHRDPLSLERVGLARTARFVGGRHEYEITELGAEVARRIEETPLLLQD